MDLSSFEFAKVPLATDLCFFEFTKIFYFVVDLSFFVFAEAILSWICPPLSLQKSFDGFILL
jgi:hypothetical protein